MTASQRVQILTDNLEGMKLLSQFLANPRLVDDLKKEVIALNKLTEQETGQLEEAKQTIKERDSVLEEITALRAALLTERGEQEKSLAADKEDFAQYRADIISKMEADREEIKRQLADATDRSSILDKRESDLKEKADLMKQLFPG